MNLVAVVSVVGTIIGALQITVLFILSDHRARIMRLEGKEMNRCRFPSVEAK